MARIKIFTFWEPRQNVPGYIRACMRTWSLIPDSEVILLDYSTIGDWLPAEEVAAVTCDRLSLPKQADCYRALLLDRYGGVWLDTDTIITPAAIGMRLFDGVAGSDVAMFGYRPKGRPAGSVRMYGACIVANRPHADLLAAWAGELPGRIGTFRRYARNPLLRMFGRRTWRRCRAFDYCLNDIIDPLVARMDSRQVAFLDGSEFNVLPERAIASDAADAEKYRDFYFRPGDPEDALAVAKSVIMLHNSWTPPEYKAMDEREFLRTDTRLAAILRKLLG